MDSLHTKKKIIKVRNLTKKFNEKIILKNINFDLYEGESLAIIGASGSGKSVLLKNIIGLLKPEIGSIKINNVETINLSRSKRENLLLELGITFQHGALFDSLTIWENVIFKIQRIKKLTKIDGQKHALDIIKNLGLGPDILNLYPSEISGGMQKRIAIARAISSDPSILLFDEPTSGLDPVTGSVIDELIVKSVKRLGASAITITHDMASVSRIADKVILIDDQTVSWTGKPNEMLKSNNAKVQQFIKALNPKLFK
ncbi:ATP-binding cassette domain-containing protein [Alphaproteobacteria bacterium]|jgi:phospholipid/cholesterol/gamma-HCH transport system ATP-binding protein|nr:ATP-binding cassette domain-containing protein [Alphaproteobacteria bacterium]